MKTIGLGRKERGAYFTPPSIANYIARWAIRSPKDRVLEPSFGDSAFLMPAIQRLTELGADRDSIRSNVVGVELDDSSVRQSSNLLEAEGFNPELKHGDFFEQTLASNFDAVVGNPPYIRYQLFSGDARIKSLEAALSHGVRLSRLASSWAAFTIHAAEHLNDNGRLGLVLPAELLSVNYAADVRKYLLGRFAKVKIILFEKLVFPGILEDVVLLLAEKRGVSDSFEVLQVRDAESLDCEIESLWRGFDISHHEKWTPALVGNQALAPYRTLLDGHGFGRLGDLGNAYLGTVTGNNAFFTLTAEDVARYGLDAEDVVRISPPGARHLRGFEFSEKAWLHLLADDARRCYLFHPADRQLSKAAREYIAMGEELKVNEAYKCRMRRPWWRAPLVDVPDLIFTYMNHDRPRMTLNSAGVRVLNSVYGVRLKTEFRNLGKVLPVAALNSATLLGAELGGRAYGGGLLKHEPKEVESLPVPNAEVLFKAFKKLEYVAPQLSIALRGDRLNDAIEIVDRVLLEEQLGLSAAAVEELRVAREKLFSRRIGRGQA